MKVLVTGSAGHLGEALMRSLPGLGYEPYGIDIRGSKYTNAVGSIVDRAFVAEQMVSVDVVLHAATLHKPHVATHSRQDFVDVNVSGTLNLLEEAVSANASAFIFTSTTSAYGDALRPKQDDPAVWITEAVQGGPKNIYGATKTAAEDLCVLFHRRFGLCGAILRVSRFFPEEDDNISIREGYVSANAKLNEFLYRRVDVEDVVSAHVAAMKRASSLNFARYIISATTPFFREDTERLRRNAASVLRDRVPRYEAVYEALGWKMFPSLDRVYDNTRARLDLEWQPKHDFTTMLERVGRDNLPQSELAAQIGKKGYHDDEFTDGPFPVEEN